MSASTRTSAPRRPRSRRPRAFLAGGLALVGVLGALFVLARPAVPADLDTSTVLSTKLARYEVTYRPDAPIPVNRLHSWTLSVRTPEGRPVRGATVRVDGDMPQHGHGLPTRPEVREAGAPGEYRVDGMKFQMDGWWVVDVHVDGAAGPDDVRFNLVLPTGR